MRRWLALLVVPALAACGEDSGGKPIPAEFLRPGGAPAAPSSPSSPTRTVSARGPAVAGGIDPGKEIVLGEVRKRTFKNEDFSESETNRDPFRSFLAEFSSGPVVNTQYKILMPKYSIDELKLVAIVGPPTGRGEGSEGRESSFSQWGAMFVDPTGFGVMVNRGDHVSKVDAKVTRIAPDRVYLELKEDLGGGKSRLVERVLELHVGEPAAEAGP